MTDTTQTDETVEILDEGWIAVDEFETDGDNPNQMTDRKYDALKRNIERYGFLVPIVADRNYIVGDGEHRLKAAEELGLNEVRAIVLDVDEIDRKILRQVLNKLQGDHDVYDDAAELDRILESQTTEMVSSLLGQTTNEIEHLVSMGQDDDSPSPVSGVGAGSGEPETVDPEEMEFDHECPRCGYEW